MRDIHEIRRRIRAVEQTRKITNATYLISSSRVKRVLPGMDYNKLYLEHLEAAMSNILASSDDFDHPYLRARGMERNTYIVISGDKGMVGSYNSDILKFALPYLKCDGMHYLMTVGVTAERFFLKNGIQPDVKMAGPSHEITLEYARHMTQDIFRLYDLMVIDEVYVIYTQFINSVRSKPCIRRLLPLDTGMANVLEHRHDMVFHPSAHELLDMLVPQYTLGILYGALMNAYASEHCARINAMQSATNNADDIMKDLKLQYNIARQSAITQELTEITAATLALE